MKRHSLYLLLAFLSFVSLASIGSVRKALCFDMKIAYAANEPWLGYRMNMSGEEIQILFETSLTSRELSVKEFCKIYGFNNLSGSSVREQWCHQKDNSMCEMQYVGAFLDNNGSITKLTVVPEYMYY